MYTVDKPVKRPVWKNHEIIGYVYISLEDKDFLNSIEDGSKVWFVYENGSLETRGAYKYCVRPNVVDGDVSVRVNIINEEDDSAIYSADEWMDELISNDYDYVAFYHIDDQFVEEYSAVFENPEEIVEDSIYAVDKDAKKLCLVALW